MQGTVAWFVFCFVFPLVGVEGTHEEDPNLANKIGLTFSKKVVN